MELRENVFHLRKIFLPRKKFLSRPCHPLKIWYQKGPWTRTFIL